MIRRRPRGETSLSKATYDHKRPRFEPPSPVRLEAATALVAVECANQRAVHKEVTASGSLVLLSQKDAFCELGIIDRFGRFVFRHEELRWITQ